MIPRKSKRSRIVEPGTECTSIHKLRFGVSEGGFAMPIVKSDKVIAYFRESPEEVLGALLLDYRIVEYRDIDLFELGLRDSPDGGLAIRSFIQPEEAFGIEQQVTGTVKNAFKVKGLSGWRDYSQASVEKIMEHLNTSYETVYLRNNKPKIYEKLKAQVEDVRRVFGKRFDLPPMRDYGDLS